MKNILVVLVVTLVFSLGAQARDTKHLFSIQDALDSADFRERLNPDIKLFFGDQPHGTSSKNFGEFVTNRKTNGVGKSDRAACEWVLLSALLVLQERAVTEGGNAVVNIRSFYKKNEMSSTTEFECHAGAIVTGVALKGTVVKID